MNYHTCTSIQGSTSRTICSLLYISIVYHFLSELEPRRGVPWPLCRCSVYAALPARGFEAVVMLPQSPEQSTVLVREVLLILPLPSSPDPPQQCWYAVERVTNLKSQLPPQLSQS